MIQIDKSLIISFAMIVGLISIFLGYKLFLKGIDGGASFEGEMQKVKLSLRNASPGLFFALFGAFIILTGIYKKDIYSEKIYTNGKLINEIYTSKGTNELESNPHYLENLFNIAVKLNKMDSIQDAIKVYETILMIDTTYHLAHNNIALLFMKHKEYSKSIMHAEMAIKYGSNSEFIKNYYDTMSKIYYSMKEYKKAEHYRNRITEDD